MEHPRVGELGKAKNYHRHDKAKAIPEGSKITFALVGNQNCGKTTLFNQLTGANQHVGNFPGVTVDRKDGVIRNHPEAVVTDLPGIYSLSPSFVVHSIGLAIRVSLRGNAYCCRIPRNGRNHISGRGKFLLQFALILCSRNGFKAVTGSASCFSSN